MYKKFLAQRERLVEIIENSYESFCQQKDSPKGEEWVKDFHRNCLDVKKSLLDRFKKESGPYADKLLMMQHCNLISRIDKMLSK